MFDEILADCLEALAKGATIRDCLKRYPAEAAALEPLLRLVIDLSREGETRLSPSAFEQGRRRLETAARARQRQSTHQAEIHHRQPRPTPVTAPQRHTPFPPYQQNGRPAPSRPMSAKPAQWQFSLPRLLRVALVLLILVGATSFIRQVATSLPGTWLYPVKNSSERMVGVLMTAAGEEVRWRGNQLERRLRELDGLTAANVTTIQRATAALESDWQELLIASVALPSTERATLIAAQIARFQQFESSWANRPGAAPQAAVVTVRKLITDGQAVVATPTPTEEATTVAVTVTAVAPTLMPTMTPTTIDTATVDTATPAVTPTALLQPSATAPGIPILEPSATPSLTLGPTLAPTMATPVPPSPTTPPTPLPEITVQIPRQESSDQESDKQEQKDEETASGAEAPTATATPLPTETTETTATTVATVTPAVGTGPEESQPPPTAVSTEAAPPPTAAVQTPVVTSGEGVFSLPTKATVPATATPEATAINTTRPTNQPGATKTPKVTATQGHTEAATVAPLTPIATKEATAETPVAASSTPPSPTVRATTSSEATKTP